jgi:hypothetical protein
MIFGIYMIRFDEKNSKKLLNNETSINTNLHILRLLSRIMFYKQFLSA